MNVEQFEEKPPEATLHSMSMDTSCYGGVARRLVCLRVWPAHARASSSWDLARARGDCAASDSAVCSPRAAPAAMPVGPKITGPEITGPAMDKSRGSAEDARQ